MVGRGRESAPEKTVDELIHKAERWRNWTKLFPEHTISQEDVVFGLVQAARLYDQAFAMIQRGDL